MVVHTVSFCWSVFSTESFRAVAECAAPHCCPPHFPTPAQVQRLMDVLVAAREPLTLQQLHRMGLPSQEVEEQLQPRLWPLLTIRDSRVSRSGVVGP